jgi:hypothetical protein
LADFKGKWLSAISFQPSARKRRKYNDFRLKADGWSLKAT